MRGVETKTPDADTSRHTSSSRSRLCRGARMMALTTGVRSGFFSSDLRFRTSPSTRQPSFSASTALWSPPPIGSSSSAATGHEARCTDPSFHHDHTSSVTNGRNGANNRCMALSASSIALLADAAAASPWSPYRLALTSSR